MMSKSTSHTTTVNTALEYSTSSSDDSSSTDDDYIPLKTIVNQQYEIKSILGEGRFGVVYDVFDTKTKDNKVLKAYKTKVETMNGEKKELLCDSNSEITFLASIAAHNYECMPVPYLYDSGTLPDGTKFMVQQKLGQTLESLHGFYGGYLPLNMVVRIGLQLLRALQFIHEHGWVHLDLKPNNVLFGATPQTSHVPYIIDFGRSKRVLDEKGNFIQPADHERYGGPLWYSSLRGHHKMALCFGDDIQCLLHVLVHLYKGYLPWLYVTDPSTVYRLKRYTPTACIYAMCPDNWIYAHNYAQELTYGLWPDYELLYRLLAA